MKLAIYGLTAGYGDAVVLRDVDLVVPTGSVAALIGPNGAGKTTLLSAASGLIRPRIGQIKLDDRDITTHTADQRVASGLCHVTESQAIFPGLTVADNLRMFASPTDVDGGIARAVEAFPKLGQRLRQQAGTMSGGEQRMLALARAYARRSSVVMVDEVSLGLAPLIVDEIFEFLARLAAEGITLLVVEQYVSKALAIADLVYVLLRGTVAFAGEAREVDSSSLADQYLGSGA